MTTHPPEDQPEDHEHHDPDSNLEQVHPDRLSSLPLLTGVPPASSVTPAPLPRAITRRGRRPVLGLAGPTSAATTTPAADAPPTPAPSPDSGINVSWATGATASPASLVETVTDQPSAADPETVAVDPTVVRQLRELASSRLTERFVGDEDEDDRKQAARATIADLLNERDRSDTFDGRTLTPPALRKALSKAVFDALFGLGRLQTLMEDDQVEDIEVNGTEPVQVQYADGTWRSYPSPFDSNAELVEYIQFLGTHHQADRPFSSAQPHLHLPLRLGEIRGRFYATGWLTDVPAIRIRIHRHVNVNLDDLVVLGTVGPDLAGFLAAAVRARRSIVISGDMGGGKALAIDTPIATPDGWTTMQWLQPGDRVFDETGAPCSVTATHAVQHNRDCYRLTFDDGHSIIADADHLWRVSSARDRARASRARHTHTLYATGAELAQLEELALQAGRVPDESLTVNELVHHVGARHRGLLQRVVREVGPDGHVIRHYGGPQRGRLYSRHVLTYSKQATLKAFLDRRSQPRGRPHLPSSQVLTTRELAGAVVVDLGKAQQTFNWQVPLTQPVEYPSQDLPIDPYVLGVWLGDGACATARISTADDQVLDQLQQAGHPTNHVGGYDHQVGNLQSGLRQLGLLGDKHIPRMYLFSSPQQRWALLQGLMDSDGSVKGRACEFYNSNHVLAAQVQELACSLGLKAHLRSKIPTFAGRTYGRAWTVSWTSPTPAFRLPRKLAKQTTASPRIADRVIVSIEPVPSVPVRCITVDSPSALYLAGRGYTPTHNTTLLRALTRCLPFKEGIVTLETERELWLNEIPGYTRVLSYEARPGSGEIDAHGRPAGMVSIADIFPHVLRANVTRIIVGEVRGTEAAAMFEAMQSGAGSLSTIHAKSAADTIERLTLAVHKGGGSESYADRLVAHQIDLIVHLKVHRDRITGERRRVIDEVLEVAPGEQGRPAITTLFAQHPGAGGTAATPRLSPSFMDDLVDEGLDPACFSTGLQQGWADA